MVQVISVTIFKNMYPIFLLTSSMRLVTLRLGHLRGLYMVGSTALVRLVSELEQGLHVFSNHEASHIKQSDKIPIQNMKPNVIISNTYAMHGSQTDFMNFFRSFWKDSSAYPQAMTSAQGDRKCCHLPHVQVRLWKSTRNSRPVPTQL